MEGTENRRSRKRFLKQLGVALAAAIGFGALASSAYAAGNCCYDPSCGDCTGGKYCFCDCSAAGEPSYCFTQPPGCVTTGCVQCPC